MVHESCLRGESEDGSGQEGKLNCDTVMTEASTHPRETLELGQPPGLS